MTGTVINERYKIISKIGSGGTADVYLAEDIKLNRKVAVKILSKAHASEKNFVARFKKEAQILARLNDPNIVAIYDWGQYENSYFICMEYVEGQSLEEIIDKHGILNPRTAAGYAIQICSALEVAHNNNLIHRDIKPQNILVTTDGILKITDFGIAKSLIEDNTRTFNILGTTYYISPEQVQGKILSYSTDIYSLGVVMYEMLTADLPFRGGNSIEISLKHINEAPMKPSYLVNDIPEQIEKIIMHCLEKNPPDRYDSVSMLKADLQNFLDKKPLLIDKPVENNAGFYKQPLLSKINIFKREPDDSPGKEFSGAQPNGNTAARQNKMISIAAFAVNLSASYVLAAVFLALFIIFAVKYSALNNANDIPAVPGVEKMFYGSASSYIKSAGLNIEKAQEAFSSEVPEGYIISQEPQAGSLVEKGTKIMVVVSKGPEKPLTVEMPNVIGLPQEDAEKILLKAGLVIADAQHDFSDTFASGIIISQEPLPGGEIKINEGVKIKISSGKNILTIPDLIGFDYMSAIAQLESIGLNTEIKKEPDLQLMPGKVTRILPAAGTQVDKGSLVVIYISTTEEMIQMPDVTQLSTERAVSILQSMNIPYDITNVAVSFEIQKNLVVGQFPSPDTFISLGEKVLLLVGS
jgi:serine/threonine-protein kinase